MGREGGGEEATGSSSCQHCAVEGLAASSLCTSIESGKPRVGYLPSFLGKTVASGQKRLGWSRVCVTRGGK